VHRLPLLYGRVSLLRPPVQLERTGGTGKRNNKKAALFGQQAAAAGADGKMHVLCAEDS